MPIFIQEESDSTKMFKNRKMKKALKNSVFKVVTVVNQYIPKNDKIVLLYSSNMGVRHNLRAVKKYLIENDYDKRYKIYCGIENMEYTEDDGNHVKYITKLKAFLLFLKAKHVFYSAGQIPIKPSNKQITEP